MTQYHIHLKGYVGGADFNTESVLATLAANPDAEVSVLVDSTGGQLATALSISQRTGSPLKSLFQQSATLVERQEELERTLAVRTAQTRLSVRVVCGLPLVMVCVLSLISPDFQQGLTTPSGTACLAVAAAMDGLALVLIRRIIDGVM
jgi:tight adherence protein B